MKQNHGSFCSASFTSFVALVRIHARLPRASPSRIWARVGAGMSIRTHSTAGRPAPCRSHLLPAWPLSAHSPSASSPIPAADLRWGFGSGDLSNYLRCFRPQSFLWTLGDKKQKRPRDPLFHVKCAPVLLPNMSLFKPQGCASLPADRA